MKINKKHDYYQQSQYYRNSSSSLMLDHRQQTGSSLMLDHRQKTGSMRATPNETSMTQLLEDDKDCGPTDFDTIDLWYPCGEDMDEDSDDSSCVIVSHDALSLANKVEGYDEESGLEMETEPAENTHLPTGVRSSRRVRFSDAPPGVYRYDKPGIDCLNQLYYTCHEMQAMREEFYLEQADMILKSRNAFEVLWSEDEDSD
jgi:hypothetical protein